MFEAATPDNHSKRLAGLPTPKEYISLSNHDLRLQNCLVNLIYGAKFQGGVGAEIVFFGRNYVLVEYSLRIVPNR